MLIYKLTLPPPAAPDVRVRELEKTIDGVVQPLEVVTDGQEIGFADGAFVSLRIRDTDDAGNVSEFSPPLDIVATDTIAPGRPDAPSLELLREE